MKLFSRLIIIASVCAVLLGGVWGASEPATTEARGATWTGYIWNNPDLAGGPIYGPFTVAAINYIWGTGAPSLPGAPGTAPADNFSLRFTTSAFFTAGTYQFNLSTNDGARIMIDGLLLVNQWPGSDTLNTAQQNYTFSADGVHQITVEYRETVGEASIIVNWALITGPPPTGTCNQGYAYTACPYGSVPGTSPAPAGWPPANGPHAICNDNWNSCSTVASGTCASHLGVKQWCLSSGGGGGTGTGWYAEFFNNTDWSGAPVYTTNYPASGLNLDWGEGSPNAAVQTDNFTARFTRTVNVPGDMPEATYLFFASADDNFRFIVDVSTVMDYTGQYANDFIYGIDIPLLPGNHTLVFEYRDIGSTAHLLLTWDPPNAQSPVVSIPNSPPIKLPDWLVNPGTGTGTGGGIVVTGITATVNIPTLNFRSTPDLSADILAKISQGESYAVTGRTADALWAQIIVNGVIGWSYANYLTFSGDFFAVPVVDGVVPTAPVPQYTGVRGRVMGNLRVREQPTTASAQIGLMPWGTEVDLLGKNAAHNWYMVSYEGIIGWSYAPWIDIIEGTLDQLPYMDGTSPLFVPAPATQGVIVQAYGNMRIRNGPGFTFPKIGVAPWGSRVQLLARSTDGLWYKIQHGALIGWSYSTWYRPVQGDPTSVPVSDQ